jgi:hypothetical protein
MQDEHDGDEMIAGAVKDGTVRLLKDKEKSLMKRFGNNEVLIKIQEVSFKDHMAELKAKFPGLKMVNYARASNGSPIWICVAGDPTALVSEIAFMMVVGADGTKMIQPIHMDSLVEAEDKEPEGNSNN